MPLVFEFSLELSNSEIKSITKESDLEEINTKELIVDKFEFKKLIITPKIFMQEYLLEIDSEMASVEEIEEAIKYIKALRIMRNL
jgi:hypothetical protein